MFQLTWAPVGQPKASNQVEVSMFLTKRSYLLMGGAVVLAAALVTGARVYADRPDLLTVPEQTPIHITLDQTVASDQVRSGDHFQATVTEPVDVKDRKS